MTEFWHEVLTYASEINLLEFLGLVFGLLAVWFLIKENLYTWPAGIIYVLISFVIFYQARLYADLGLHVVFLILNVYGWYYWVNGKKADQEDLPVTRTTFKSMLLVLGGCIFGIFLIAELLKTTDAALPYWDSTTTAVSVGAMWLQARKKIESWYLWLFVDLLATGIYINREIYFYATLYGVYIILAVIGWQAWKKSMSHA